MRWLAKAAAAGLGVLPGRRAAELRLPAARAALAAGGRQRRCRQKFSRALQHLGVYEEHGPGVPAGDATFYEFGAGWDTAIPVAYALLGVGRQVLVDIRPSARVELVNDSLASYERLRGELEGEAGSRAASARRADLPAGGAGGPLRDPLPRALRRARHRPPAESIDFVSSTDTCEHIPAASSREIFRECFRLLQSRRRLQLPDRPAGPLRVLRPRRCRATTSSATPTTRGGSSTRRSTTRTASARPSTCSWCATRLRARRREAVRAE